MLHQWSPLDLLHAICHFSNHISRPRHRRQPYSSSSAQRGSARQSSRPSSSQRSSSPFRQQSGRKGDSRFHKKSSRTPRKRGGFSEVGALSLDGGRRLPSQLLVGLEGSGGGRLGSGGSAGWLSDPLRPSTSSIRASALPASVLPSVHQGSRLNPGASKPSSEGGSRASPTVSRVFTAVYSSSRRLRGHGAPSSICRP